MTHPFHPTKFRWTENLTSRFIQLRKENGNLFTGRKYSAQAGWEHILQQMRREFPTIMADVHYRVLKKKWSNLLQQYKELKNPVHGDKNKSDDVSWPFYGAIDEVVRYVQRNDDENENENENDNEIENENDDDLNPHEFLCLSVTPEEPASPDEDQRLLIDNNSDFDDHHKPSSIAALRRIPNLSEDFSIEIERLPRVPIRRPRLANNRASQISEELRRRDVSEVLVSRLPPATELSIKTIRTSGSSVTQSGGLRVRSFANNVNNSASSPSQFLRDTLAAEKRRNGNHSVVCNYNASVNFTDEVDDDEIEEEEQEEEEDPDDEETGRPPPRKIRRSSLEPPSFHGHECNLERRLNEFLEYTKKRDEENRLIMTRILNAVEKIAEKQ